MELLQEAEFELQEVLTETESSQRSKVIKDFVEKMDTQLKKIMPDFKQDLEWLNVTSPLSIQKDLQGKLVVLDFFTYCCVNCLHILPDLENLEEKYSIQEGVVVIGVHSAKFSNEKVLSNILSAVLRYNINHPVVNDFEAIQWNNFQISCWPTLVILGPEGQYLKSYVGEGHIESLFEFIDIALGYFREKNQLNSNSLPLSLEKNKQPATVLNFPGKVAVSGDGKLLAVADTGHHRILLMGKDGIVKSVIGGQQRGFKNGRFMDCLFHSPQGLVFAGDTLYVADTENHAIRKVDIASCVVTTVVGTGKQGQDKEGGKQGLEQEISSPWDLILGNSQGSEEEDILYIAMAGTHQIWVYFLQDGKLYKGRHYKSGTCVRFAGSGNEENRNNNYPEKAAFAQPSGLALSSDPTVNALYVADSESSTVRCISLKDGSTKAFVGGERDPMNLFGYGDTDGVGVAAKLQHPLGVALLTKDSGPLLVADSYNHEIKSVNLKTKECTVWRWSEDKGNNSVVTDLNEPGGICVDQTNRLVYIADTNNHTVRVADLDRQTVVNLPILFPESSNVDKPPKKQIDFIKPGMSIEDLSTMELPPGGSLELCLSLNLPDGIHLTEEAPNKWMLAMKDTEESLVNFTGDIEGSINDKEEQTMTSVTLPDSVGSDSLYLYIKCVLYTCDNLNTCNMKETVYKQEIVIQENSEKSKQLTVVLA